MERKFVRDRNNDYSLLAPLETKFTQTFLPKLPRWLETYHLTLLSIIWSALIIILSFLAKQNLAWFWLASLVIVFHWITDTLDGPIGRERKTGLVRWGYYMDHFLDYMYLCSIFIGYSFIVPDHSKYLLFFILAVFTAFMVSAYLASTATGEFKITFLKVGATEIQLGFILINIVLIFRGPLVIESALVYTLGASFIVLAAFVYQTQRKIWRLDSASQK